MNPDAELDVEALKCTYEAVDTTLCDDGSLTVSVPVQPHDTGCLHFVEATLLLHAQHGEAMCMQHTAMAGFTCLVRHSVL